LRLNSPLANDRHIQELPVPENILLFMRKSHRRSWSFAILTYNTNSSTNSTKFTHLFTHNTNTANVTPSLLAQFQFTYIQEKYYLNKRKITTNTYTSFSLESTDSQKCGRFSTQTNWSAVSGDLEVTSQKCTIFYNIYNTRSQQICKTVQLLISCLSKIHFARRFASPNSHRRLCPGTYWGLALLDSLIF